MESVGEFEPILGVTVENRASQAIRGELSEEEQTTRVNESANSMKDQRLEA